MAWAGLSAGWEKWDALIMDQLGPVGAAMIELSEHVSLAVAALQKVDEGARERIRETAIATVTAFEKDGKVRVPGMARCIVGTKHES